ncbi:hypothetical protein [Kitasatospora griseola]|uniref:hypothetical protein n=1 Tax=Kitasatospora griseola TaxID=2064 RepID=UPI003668C71A
MSTTRSTARSPGMNFLPAHPYTVLDVARRMQRDAARLARALTDTLAAIEKADPVTEARLRAELESTLGPLSPEFPGAQYPLGTVALHADSIATQDHADRRADEEDWARSYCPSTDYDE